MAEEITLSIMQQRVGDVENTILPLLQDFEAETHIHVNVQALSWSEGLDTLLQTALHGTGPDVSEIGTTWVSSFVAMNSLQPFQPADIKVTGGETGFLPGPWQTGKVEGGDQLWAMPWMVGMRVFFYRRDLFQKANLDPQTAFQTHQALDQALEQLRANGVKTPWAVPTIPTINTLHYVSNWVWSAGGYFASQNGQEVLFNSPKSRIGLKRYYKLGRFFPPPGTQLDPDRVSDLFWKEGKTAVMIGGHWQLPAYQQTASPEIWENIGVAPMPGIVFLGGSNLVIWEHVRNKAAAVRLIRFLNGHRVQKIYPPRVGLYPVHRETLSRAPYTEDPIYQNLAARFETGRAYPAVSLWGVIERRLPRTLADIWQAYLKNPASDLDEILQSYLDPLAKRLAITLRR